MGPGPDTAWAWTAAEGPGVWANNSIRWIREGQADLFQVPTIAAFLTRPKAKLKVVSDATKKDPYSESGAKSSSIPRTATIVPFVY